MKHGHGKYVWNDGSMYEGQWCENKINGSGIYVWPDGRKYMGEWYQGKQHGRGTYIKEGKKREGIWDMGKRIEWIKN